MKTIYLIKYAEIGVKGKNRYVFEDALMKQIRFALGKDREELTVRRAQGRIYIDAPDEYDPVQNSEETVAVLQKVFGISGICPVIPAIKHRG